MADSSRPTAERDPFQSVTEHFPTASGFVDRLIELQDDWVEDGGWIFRGQNDANWPLTPKLFRVWKPEYGTTYEFRLVDNFVRNANLVQLDIPGNVMNYAIYYRNRAPAPALGLIDKETGDGLVYDYTHAAFAIAQHSGIPTRLLDFTYDALAAAFFACDNSNLLAKLGLSDERLAKHMLDIVELCEDAEDKAVEVLRNQADQINRAFGCLPDNLAVWALKVNVLEHKTNLRVVNHAHSEILNLRAQKGLFVIHKDIINLEDERAKSIPSFSEEVLKLKAEREVLKLSLPRSEASDLKEILEIKHKASMYLLPSYSSVAEIVLQSQELWRGK